MKTAAQPRQPTPIYYPDTDFQPMAESDFQRKPLTYLVEALDLHFQTRPEVYVSGNLLIYYEEGQPKKSFAPDVFVVFGIPKHDRNIYQIWVEGKAPDVVIEITSRTTHQVDDTTKPRLYQQLGVREYFQYDPTGQYLKPALRGRSLNEDGYYEPMNSVRGLDGTVMLTSPLLGLQLRLEAGQLRLFDATTGDYLDTYSEAVMGRRQAAFEMQLERQRAQQAESEILLERQRAQQAESEVVLERQRAEAERQRAQQAESEVLSERQRAQQAESEAQLERQRAEKLAAQLRALGLDPDQLV